MYQATEQPAAMEFRSAVSNRAGFLSGAGFFFFGLIKDTGFISLYFLLVSCSPALSRDLIISALYRLSLY